MSQRKPLIAGNWKMYKTTEESVAFVKELHGKVGTSEDVEVVVAPTSVALHSVGKALEGSSIKLSSQNVYPQAQGAFTGELSAPMLRAVGCTFCIIGHSERRQYFNENDEFVREKAQALLSEGLTPILCLGESLEERESGQTFTRVSNQISAALKGFDAQQAQKIVIAYEPIWAIGTGKTASPEQAQEVHQFLRQTIRELLGEETASKMRILYGGSVKPNNIKMLMAQDDIDGALVGGASLDVDSFCQLVQFKS